MTGIELKQSLRSGQRVYGTCVISTSPAWPPLLASTGLDFVFIDTEHIPIDRAQLSWMCRTYSAVGLSPIVRIPKPDPYLACMALDGGAVGIVAPYLESVAEVQELRGAVKYRPLKGAQLEGVLSGSETLNSTTRAYLERYNENNLCIVNIESVPAIDALDDILSVPDIDAILIGPHDLSINLGIPEDYTHPDFSAAIACIVKKSRAAGIGVGYHFSFGIETAIAWAKFGANFIVHSADVFLVRDALSHDLQRFHEALGDGRKAETSSETGGDDIVV